MIIKIPKIKKNEQLFFISFITCMFFSMLVHSFYYRYFASLYKYIVLFCLILLVFQEIINKSLARKALVGAIVLYVIALFVIIRGRGSTQIAFACIFPYAFSARNVEFRKIETITIYLTYLVLGLVILSSILGIIPNYFFSNGLRDRFYLGFRYALNASAFFGNVVLLTINNKKERIKVHSIFILLAFSLFLYKATDARLSFGVSIGAILIAIIYKMRKDSFTRLHKPIIILLPSFIVCSGLSLWLTIRYSPSIHWMREINTFFGNRLHLGQKSIMQYGINMFGNKEIEWVGMGLDMYGNRNLNAYLYVDNMYIQLLQRYGVIFFVIFIMLATVLMVQCYKNQKYLTVVVLLILALRGLIDDAGLYLHFNTFWILFGSATVGSLNKSQSIINRKNFMENASRN